MKGLQQIILTNVNGSTIQHIQESIESHGDEENTKKWTIIADKIKSDGSVAVEIFQEHTCGCSCWKMMFGNMKLVIPAIPVITVLFRDTDSEINKPIASYLESLQENEDGDRQRALEEASTKWKMARDRLVQQLQVVAIEVRNHRKRSNKTKVAGAVVSVGGTILGIVGLGLSIATFGVASPIMIAGGTIAGAGGVTVIGSSIAAELFSSRGAKEADKLINECNVTFANLQEVRKKYQDDLRVHMKFAQMIDKVRIVFEKVEDSIRIIIIIGNKISTQFIGTIKNDIVKVFRSGSKIEISDAGKAVTGVLRFTASTVGRTLDEIGGATFRVAGMSLKIAGIALAGVAIIFDMHTLITTSIDIHKGNLDKAADEIEKIAENLKNMKPPTAEDTMIDSLKSVADELEIPCDVVDIDN